MDWQDMIFGFIGGLGIFLFGIKFMSDGLQKTAGDRMRGLLETYTTNPLLGVLVGIFVTILLQTSTGTTVMAIGLVNAGLMTLRQAIGVIMGANIGTTLTAFIIGIKIEDYALPIIALGSFFLFFTKQKSYQYIGQVIFGFGALFLGLKTMGGGLKPLKDLQAFHDFIATLDNPFLGVLVGTVFTVIVQSSSATIGILQQIADEGMIELYLALPVLFGDNIGTTITAVIAAIGATVAAKRAAAAHVIFNVIGTIIFIIALPLVYQLVVWLGDLTDVNIRMQIAYAHGIFNVTNALIQLPFVALIAYIVTKLISGELKQLQFGAKYLDERLLATPSVGLGQAQYEIVRMGEIARESLNDSANYFFTTDQKLSDLAIQKEELINHLDKKINEYLIKLQQSELNPQEAGRASILMQAINDIERIGDHAENMLELADYSITHKVEFSDQALDEMKHMINIADSAIDKAIQALAKNDSQLAMEVLELESELDHIEREYRKSHINRLNMNLCTGNSGAVFLDMLSNLERMGDHSKNIAQYVLYGE